MAWRIANSLLKLRDQVNLAVPNRNKNSDGAIGDAAHAARTSDHNPWVKDGTMGVVTAIDITHDPKHGVDTYKLAEHLRQTKDSRIKYVISNKRIFSFEVSPWQWRRYTGSNPHDEHIHISVRPVKSLYDWEMAWNLGELIPKADAEQITDHPLLKYGSTGPAVARVQELLGVTPEFVPDNRGIVRRTLDSVLRRSDPEKAPWFGPRTEKYVKDFQSTHELVVDGIVGPYTWRALEGTLGAKKINRNIIATVFGGKADPQKSAYTGKLLSDAGYYVALPYRFTGKRPKVKVTSRSNGTALVAEIADVGPWNINDPYWTKTDGRPQAESGTDTRGRKTNGAGIDLSPAAAKALDINGKGLVDWSFE